MPNSITERAEAVQTEATRIAREAAKAYRAAAAFAQRRGPAVDGPRRHRALLALVDAVPGCYGALTQVRLVQFSRALGSCSATASLWVRHLEGAGLIRCQRAHKSLKAALTDAGRALLATKPPAAEIAARAAPARDPSARLATLDKLRRARAKRVVAAILATAGGEIDVPVEVTVAALARVIGLPQSSTHVALHVALELGWLSASRAPGGNARVRAVTAAGAAAAEGVNVPAAQVRERRPEPLLARELPPFDGPEAPALTFLATHQLDRIRPVKGRPGFYRLNGRADVLTADFLIARARSFGWNGRPGPARRAVAALEEATP